MTNVGRQWLLLLSPPRTQAGPMVFRIHYSSSHLSLPTQVALPTLLPYSCTALLMRCTLHVPPSRAIYLTLCAAACLPACDACSRVQTVGRATWSLACLTWRLPASTSGHKPSWSSTASSRRGGWRWRRPRAQGELGPLCIGYGCHDMAWHGGTYMRTGGRWGEGVLLFV